MARPTWRQFASRWWEFRPTSTGVIVMTLGTVLWKAILDWPVLVCILGVLAVTAAVTALLAALELSNEAADLAEEDEPEASES